MISPSFFLDPFSLFSSYPMDDRSLKALDFHHFIDLLKEFSTSPLGQKRCEALRPSNDLQTIQQRMAEVLELKDILEIVGRYRSTG